MRRLKKKYFVLRVSLPKSMRSGTKPKKKPQAQGLLHGK
jgi:hypothetical protein